MSTSTAALSRTLKTITLTKFKELEKQRKSYEKAKHAVLEAAAEDGIDSHTRIRRLLQGVQDLLPTLDVDSSPHNIRRWLEQAQFDSSITDSKLDVFAAQLHSQLKVQTRKLDLAALYSRLLTEWLDTTKSQEELLLADEPSSIDGSFDFVEKDRLKELTDKFEAVVFDALETNTDEIANYLGEFFQGGVRAKALDRLRSRMEGAGMLVKRVRTPFTEETIQWCLKGLLANDLLRDDKKAILQEFLQDEVARKEICDVLNMKFVDLKNWEWDCDERGLSVEPRPQLNGKYRIMMDEDILDAIFLHYIGTMWAVKTKDILRDTVRNGEQVSEIWKTKILPSDVRERRKYFLGEDRVAQEASNNVEAARLDMYRQDFFLSQLPSTVTEGAGGYDDERQGEGNDDEDGWGRAARVVEPKKTPKEIKQQLLRLMATEVHLHKALHGKVAAVQSDFKWFGTAIPHSTIFAVLRFMGVGEGWVQFFKKFLEVPLDMSPSSGDTSSARIRKRGVPMAHALEKFFGEAVLFFMDLAVNHESEMLLYRFHDDLWLVGQPEACATAWQAMQRFSKIMGLEFNESKTGSVLLTNEDFTYEDSQITARLPQGPITIGFLGLDPKSGDWLIDQKQVDAHVKQLSKQLATTTSILSWVQTWNSCIGRFFSHTFGEPAVCFGRKHVDAILDTHKRMQETLFPGSNSCRHLKGLIKERFGVKDIPDAFIFLPEALGGLEVRNPFIAPFMVRENLSSKGPSAHLDGFFQEENDAYEVAKREFEAMSFHARKRRLQLIFTNAYGELCLPSKNGEELDTFMSREEFTQCRESISPALKQTYELLMDVPRQVAIIGSDRVDRAMATLTRSQPELGRDDKSGPREEMRWILQTYERELMETCGGMSIVERNLLPLGILTILRKRKVAWQMVL